MFANQNKEDSIYPLTTREIVEAQQQDPDLKKNSEKEGFPPSWSKTSQDSVKWQSRHTIEPTTAHSSLISPLLATPQHTVEPTTTLSILVSLLLATPRVQAS